MARGRFSQVSRKNSSGETGAISVAKSRTDMGNGANQLTASLILSGALQRTGSSKRSLPFFRQRHRLARRSEQRRWLPARLPAHQRQLSAVMNVMKKDEVHEDVADWHGLAVEKYDRAIEVLRLQLPHARHRIGMDAREAGRELFDRARPRHPVRSHVAGKLSAFDTERAIALGFDEVPGQLAEGSGLRVGTEIVAVARQRPEELLRLRRFPFPDLNET